MKRIVLLLSLLIVCTGVQAQFSLTGSDPSKVRWMQMSSPEFRIIYPEGEDSLARVYGTWLEKARIGVSRSSGLLAGENYKRRMPVVLHSFNTIPNASVAWAPRRMDFFTAPDAYSPTPVPWEKLLAIHEGRHVSQMNAGVAGRNKVFKYLTGELFAGAFADRFDSLLPSLQSLLHGQVLLGSQVLDFLSVFLHIIIETKCDRRHIITSFFFLYCFYRGTSGHTVCLKIISLI